MKIKTLIKLLMTFDDHNKEIFIGPADWDKLGGKYFPIDRVTLNDDRIIVHPPKEEAP